MVINTQNSEHYTWGHDCDGWHLLKSDTLSVIQELMPSGAEEGLHYHSKAQQLFFVLKGSAVMEVEGTSYVLYAQDSLHIAPGLKHKISNVEAEDLHFLVISEPKAHGDRTNVEV